MQNYTEATQELIEKAGIPKEWIYHFEPGNASASAYQVFHHFCQVNLDETYAHLNISPSKFYFNSSSEFNANYSIRNGFRILHITKQAFDELTLYFYNRKIDFNAIELPDYDIFNNNLNAFFQGKFENPLGLLMFQSASIFLFYHEMGHLIQFLDDENKEINEMFAAVTIGNSKESHILEMDADLAAAHKISQHCIHFWGELPDEMRTDDNHIKLITIAASSIFVVFLRLSNNQPFYIEGYSHPHPIVRILYIIDYMMKSAKSIFDENQTIEKDILRGVYKITDALTKDDPNFAGLADYADVLFTQQRPIQEYVSELVRLSDDMKFLCRHKNIEP